MSLVTVKRIPDKIESNSDQIKSSKSQIEFEKEFNFQNLKQIYDDTKSNDIPKNISRQDSTQNKNSSTCLTKYFVIKDAALILPRRKQNRSKHQFDAKTNEHDESLIDDKSLFRYQNQIEQQQNQSIMNEPNGTTGDILTHLKSMVHLLRPYDTISVAVKLSSYYPNKIRYLVIVETISPNSVNNFKNNDNTTDNEDDYGDYDSCCKESAILGLDLCLNSNNEDQLSCTVGLVMPIYANCEISLNGDGGFKFKTHHSTHIFKPVSIQAMWSSYQYLHKAFENARKRNFYSISTASMSSLLSNNSNENNNEITSYKNHEWVEHYSMLINKIAPTYNSSSSSSLNEWYQKEERTSQREDFTTPYFDGLKLKIDDEEIAIKIKEKLKEIMISSKDDYGSMSSIYIRELLEKELEIKLDDFKKFIDVTIFQFYNQLVECASQLLPYLYLGTEWNASNYDSLIADNVTHILNVSSEVDNFFPDTFKYLNIRVLDIDQTDLIKEFDRTNKFIQEAKEQSTSCLVHCKMGVSRSASVCLAFLMKEFDWSFDQAFNYTKNKRNCINPNDGFRSQLATYESILNAHKAKKNLFEPLTTTVSSSSMASQQFNLITEQINNEQILPSNKKLIENQLFQQQPTETNEKIEISKCSVKETINKLKSISSSEQLLVQINISSPPISPEYPKISFLLSPTSFIKRTTSHLTTKNEIINSEVDKNFNEIEIHTNDENQITRPLSIHCHQRSKSGSNFENLKNQNFLFNKSSQRQTQSWSSHQFDKTVYNPKLKQISSNNFSDNNTFKSENNLNFNSKNLSSNIELSSSSSSSSSIRSAIKNSLILSNNLNQTEENGSIHSTGNVKRQVESINFKSRPCSPQNDNLENKADTINSQMNLNKRQSIISLGESIAEVDDDPIKLKLENIIEASSVAHLDCSNIQDESKNEINTTSPDGKRFKFELLHQFQQPIVEMKQTIRPKKVFQFLAEKKNDS